ncbi:2,5-diamino-6-(ribosylamino)-4(3H)-pyrimidinone 5'-phosphate reductase [Tulasnella sp. 417]|nr:2,5-diamino-6-(ribosylamino)-4(3H)-pyrimidinone 5'-phosphate reductase [Tulasnella sp. 417]
MASPATTDPESFLKSVLNHASSPTEPPQNRPFVTLTYAQSLDGKIAGKGGKQLILSGNESMLMTHWMRTMHEGIMVGIGTALNDDPQLNSKLPARTEPYPQPIPIILDSQLRFRSDCKLVRNYGSGSGRQPWVLCAEDAEPKKRESLETAGVKVVPVKLNPSTGKLDLDDVLSTLRAHGVKSLMVEGGQQVISSFLSHNASSTGKNVLDTIIVTVAPTYVGNEGVSALDDGQLPAKVVHVSSTVMGRDSIVACRPSES